jgi:UDP-glucose 4-epimerase
MKILVTGGAGFIGSHVVDAYIEAGHEVVILDNLVSGKKENINSQAKFVEGDITLKEVIEGVFHKCGPFDAVNHLAAQKSVTESVKDPIFDAQTNIIGSLNIFECARQNKVKKIIFSSTGGALYGDGVEIPTSEDAKIAPLSPYGISKYTVENYLRFYQEFGIKTAILRYANVYGPRQDPHGEAGVVAIFSQKVLNNEPIIIFGSGEQTRDFVYVKDVIKANLLAIETNESFICNIGTGQETSVNLLANQLKNIAQNEGLNVSEIIYKDARLGELQRSVLNITRAKEILNWQPEISFENGIKETMESFK